MIFKQQHQFLYAAFDIFPSTKGAGKHIYHFTNFLYEKYNDLGIFVLGDQSLASYELNNNLEIYRFQFFIENYLEKAEAFGETLNLTLSNQNNLKIAHFRDIWSGIPILLNPKKNYKTIFEVNGLPSIELIEHYPNISISTLKKINELEEFCLKNADKIIVPSDFTANYLVQKEINNDKIEIIYNGADPNPTFKNFDTPENYIIYFGAVQPWQGVDILVRAFAKLKDKTDLKLVICASLLKKNIKLLQKLASKLEIEDRIIWNFELKNDELNTWIKNAKLSIAPLTECGRNLIQGCFPLKIVESMALETPLICSDLPVLRCILNDEETFFVKPNRPSELALAIRFLLENDNFRMNLAKNAKIKFINNFTCDKAKEKLLNLYKYITI